MLHSLLLIVYLTAVPAIVMLLARKWKWIDRVSPMAVLYVVGLLVANFTPLLHDEGLLALNNTAGALCIPLAIPLMLMSCNLRNWSAKGTAKAFLSGIMSILVAIVAGHFIFRQGQDPRQFAQVSAVAVGIYTGGIPNMGAIARGVGMDQSTYLFITSYDLIVTGLYLVFVILFGKPLFRKVLESPKATGGSGGSDGGNAKGEDTKATATWVRIAVPMGVTAVIAAASYAAATLFPEELSTPMLILILTTLSIGASFLPFVRRAAQPDDPAKQSESFNIGLYFIYIFCFSVANACDVRQMDLGGSLSILGFITFIIFGSLALQILFARLLHIDSDLTLTTSVSLINSPPFVPMVAGLLGNKDVIIPGITIGLIGYMVGNYLGLGVYFLLVP